MTTEQGTSIGRTVTLLMIFVVTVVVIIFIFAYFTGLFHFISASTDTDQVSGAFAVAGGGGSTGTLVIQVKDTSSASIVGLQVLCPASQFQVGTCAEMQLLYNGGLVSKLNPVPDKAIASGTGTVLSATGTTFSAGEYCTLSVTALYSDGSNVTQTFQVAAQA